MPHKKTDDKLKNLSEKIAAAEQEPETQSHLGEDYGKTSNTAVKIVIEFIVPIVMGVGIGYWIDQKFETLPIFILIFTLLGFATGIRNTLRLANQDELDE